METTRKAVGNLLEAVPRQAKIKRSAYYELGQFPIVDQSQAFVAGYTDDERWLYRGELPVIIFGDHTRVLKLINFPFCVGADGTQLLRPVDGIDIRFLYYALRNLDLTNYGYERHFKYLKEEQIEVPRLPIQRRIAGILSAYDELMENCQRRIRILDEMARALYREWFVHFRFPGHEKVPRVDSPIGPMPQGWEVKPLFDLAEVKYGKNLPTKVLTDDGAYPVYGAAKIIGRHTEYTREQRTILCGCRGSVGEMQITLPRCFVTNNSFTFDPSHPDNFFWLFHNLRDRGLDDVIGGAAQPQITLDGISSVELLAPPLPLRTRFQRTVTPIFEQAWTLGGKIENLRRTRDLLLPRLLSGQVSLDVSAVEDVAEPTAPAAPRSQVALGNALPGEVALRAGGVSAGGRTDSHPQTPPPCEVKLRSESHSQVQLGNEEQEEAPASRAADEAPVPIDQIDRTAVLQVIRQVFSAGPPRERDAAIRDVARALGYRRTGARIHEILHTDLLTAVRRGILENTGGALRLLARSITGYERDFLKQQFLAAIGRTWIDRDDAIRDFCRWLGFARTGPVIEDTARSLINGLLREGRLEADGAEMIRRV